MTIEPHNRIISKVAKEILSPLGIFRKGNSRTWIDDNQWYFTIIEFQPSAWDKGTYLNVGAHYLWGCKEYFSFDYGSREGDFITYNGNDDEFYKSMYSLIAVAKERVLFYRKFQDLSVAKKMILERTGFQNASYELYNKMMISFLDRDYLNGKNLCRDVLINTKDSYLVWEQEIYNTVVNEITPIIKNDDLLREFVVNRINLSRQYWQTKSSMKKMNESQFY